MSDQQPEMTENTAQCVAAVLATPSQWATTAQKILDEGTAKRFAKDKRSQLAQFMLFLQHTQTFWTRNAYFVETLRNKLEHFYTIDEWEPAGYFLHTLFPEQVIAMA
jgi:hypothetical protein